MTNSARFPVQLLAALGVTFAAILPLPNQSSADELEGRAPNFRGVDLEGENVSLEELLGKGPILVDFWATWCKPCIKELPYIQRLHDEYGEKGLTVLAVSIDSPKHQSRVKPFIKGKNFTFRVLLDGTQEIFKSLQGKGQMPYVVVLDAEGVIRYRHTGYRPGDEKELEKHVLELLAGEEESPSESQDVSPEEAAG